MTPSSFCHCGMLNLPWNAPKCNTRASTTLKKHQQYTHSSMDDQPYTIPQ
jgi:hypothetical protein